MAGYYSHSFGELELRKYDEKLHSYAYRYKMKLKEAQSKCKEESLIDRESSELDQEPTVDET